MRINIFIIIILIHTLASCQNNSFINSKQIPVQVEYTSTTFPPSWKESPISGISESLDKSEIYISKNIVSKALGKYPNVLLNSELKIIYVLKSLNFYGVNYGGTNSNDCVYLANSGVGNGYTDDFIEATFHHEFSSILLRNHPELFNQNEWNTLLPAGFQYGSGGVDAIKNGQSSMDLNDSLNTIGFLNQYSLSAVEEDFNCISESLFTSDVKFWQRVNDNSMLLKKVNYVINFYSKLNSQFSIQYFRSIEKK